jgi:hypothetical protein
MLRVTYGLETNLDLGYLAIRWAFGESSGNLAREPAGSGAFSGMSTTTGAAY